MVDAANATPTRYDQLLRCPKIQRRLQHQTPMHTHSSNCSSAVAPNVTISRRNNDTGGRIATITVSHPAKLNIVSSLVLDKLILACAELSIESNLRAVVLEGGDTVQGKSPAFIGGADIKEMNQLSSSKEAETFISRIHHACKALRDLPTPVIARIDGYCLGAGLEIAAACDLRIATERSVFGMPEVNVGIPSVVEAALLPGLIGMGRTRRLLYLAENINAVTAERWGLVERLVDSRQELDDAVTEWVTRIAKTGPHAMTSQKRLTQTWENVPVDDGITAGVKAFSECYDDGGQEPKSFMEAFTSRRRS
ncbi:hypothetical protein KC343_g5522 [Hortaea werneckii]|uniref:Enoyl-CoA hydratase n=1 Tax=Hortaea werneckii TaxID=91943 RepID=A0A3M7G2P6_HORWE|nr:hypothetical protein KC338_g7682 [Hortaea werneckii]KAI7568421.1 hypothetical protein KC317_g4206 [Hortaea werneckii]KAI7617497.1 hypothetical protein KC346_g5443 [Hortaea werneckii]KAI7628947.1 hypothetical protein KC343_g5522 [Hortaea werneckii]KAI7674684.1 hypothetical protein KC319_g4764 [Hortaea werneckii]